MSPPSILPPLDPGFVPASLWTRTYQRRLKESGEARPLALALERPDGTVSRFDTQVFRHSEEYAGFNRRYIEDSRWGVAEEVVAYVAEGVVLAVKAG